MHGTGERGLSVCGPGGNAHLPEVMKNVRSAALLSVLLASAALALPQKFPEGTDRTFPIVVDPASGRILATGQHQQNDDGDRLRVETSFNWKDGRRTAETQLFQQGSQLIPVHWHWEERRGDVVLSAFDVDFTTGNATAQTDDGHGHKKEWHDHFKIHPGTTFAGSGFVYALKNVAPGLTKGNMVELEAVGFTPRPRTAKVRLSLVGTETLTHGGKPVQANRYLIRPDVPGVARLFVKVPDTSVWLLPSNPPALLAAEGPVMLPSDPIVRTEVDHLRPRAVGRRGTGSR